MNHILIGVLTIIGVSAATQVCKRYSLNRDDAKLKEAESLFIAIPSYPDSREIGASSTSKERIANVGKTYASAAGYDELKHYYNEALTELGWQLERERQVSDWGRDLGGRELKFRNGEYYVSLQYAGPKANYGWDYSLTVGWRPR